MPLSQQLSVPTPEDFAYSRLISYAAYQWPGYKDAHHHRLIARHLEAVERGDIKRLMITMPPRHGKSMLASEFFPAWYIGRNPDHYVVTATYAQELADDFGRKVKNQIEDDAYKAIFPGVSLADDSKSAKRFHIDGNSGGYEHSIGQRGAFYAVGVGGPLTGRGAHLLLIDDPVKNREDAESEVIRKKTKDWYTSTAYTRLMPGGRIVIIQTRWHEDDLAGWLQAEHEHEGWVVLNLPAINDAGEALWPEQYDIEALEQIKRALPPRDWSALYQQSPSPETGDYFKKEWIYEVDSLPPRETLRVYGGSDYAVTSNGGDYTVHAVVGIDPQGNPWLLDMWRHQTSSDKWVEAFCDLVKKWKPIGWAEETGQIKSGVGPFLVKRMIEREAYVTREAFATRGDKAVRAQAIRGRMAMKGLRILRDAPCKTDLINEMMSFPVGVHDDQCVVGETLVCTPDGLKRIDCLSVGDKVSTPNGSGVISACEMTNEEADIVRIRFSGGYLDCTPNHPVYVKNKGFVRADALGIMDELTFIGEPVCNEEVQRPMWWNISEIGIDVTQMGKAAHIKDITTAQNQEGAFSTVTSGKTPMVQSLRDTTSITSTETQQTTNFPTWRAYLPRIIASAIQWMRRSMRGKLSILSKFGRELLNGTDRLKASLGIARMPRNLGKKERSFEPIAVNAPTAMKPLLRDLCSVPVHVLSVTELSERRPVFNITVDGEHVYYANGILTHNCDALGLVGQLLDRMTSGRELPEPVEADEEEGFVVPPIQMGRRRR